MSQRDRYTCEHVFSLLDDYVDRELSAEQMTAVRQHLETCADCASEYRFEASVIQAVRERVQHIAVSETLRVKVANALKRAIADAQAG